MADDGLNTCGCKACGGASWRDASLFCRRLAARRDAIRFDRPDATPTRDPATLTPLPALLAGCRRSSFDGLWCDRHLADYPDGWELCVGSPFDDAVLRLSSSGPFAP